MVSPACAEGVPLPLMHGWVALLPAVPLSGALASCVQTWGLAPSLCLTPCGIGVQCLAGVEGLAILTSADFLLDIQSLAVDNDIEPSTACVGGWKVWVSAVRSLGQGHLPPDSSGARLADL